MYRVKVNIKKAKYNKIKFYVKYKCLIKSVTFENILYLNDTSNYHDINNNIKLINVLHEFNNRFIDTNY